MSHDNAQNEIIKSFGLGEYPEELQEVFLNQFGELLFKAIMLRGVEEVPASAAQRFDNLIATNPTPEKVFAFFEEHIENFDGIIAEVVTNLKKRSDDITHEFLEEVREEM